MAKYPDKYFDLAIVDPPYGIGYDVMQNNIAGSYRVQNRGTWKQYKKTDWDSKIPGEGYFLELMRVSKYQIVWGGNFFGMPKSKCWLIWNKIQRDNRADAELAWTNFDKPTKLFDYSRADAYINDCDMKIHPTQKPVKLYEWLLKNYAKPEDKILDTHLGSGSIAIACHNMGFDLVGYEIDKYYYEDAKKRLEEHQRQIQMFV